LIDRGDQIATCYTKTPKIFGSDSESDFYSRLRGHARNQRVWILGVHSQLVKIAMTDCPALVGMWQAALSLKNLSKGKSDIIGGRKLEHKCEWDKIQKHRLQK
jgi:hypothetical protein